MHENHNINSSYKQVWREREYVIAQVRESVEDSFVQLSIYLHNLVMQTPGTVTHLVRDKL